MENWLNEEINCWSINELKVKSERFNFLAGILQYIQRRKESALHCILLHVVERTVSMRA